MSLAINSEQLGAGKGGTSALLKGPQSTHLLSHKTNKQTNKNSYTLASAEFFPCASLQPRLSLHPPSQFILLWRRLSSPFYRWVNGGSEAHPVLPEATQMGGGEQDVRLDVSASIESHFFIPSSCLHSL